MSVSVRQRPAFAQDSTLYMDTAQLLLSLLHAWGMDADLDRVCVGKLGLLRPAQPLCYGLVSPRGHMTLMLPSYAMALAKENEVGREGSYDTSVRWGVGDRNHCVAPGKYEIGDRVEQEIPPPPSCKFFFAHRRDILGTTLVTIVSFS